MNKLSTGADSTLGNYLDLAKLFFGTDSKATKFLEDEIAKSPNGRDEEVIAAESQMVYALGQIHLGKTEHA